MDNSHADDEWFRHPAFDHFWHIHEIRNKWMKNHNAAVHQVHAQLFGNAGSSVENETDNVVEPEVTERLSRCEIQNEIHGEEPEVEVMSEEMRNFFARTQEHRQQLKEKREAEKEKEEAKQPKKNVEYVNVQQITVRGRVEHSTDQRDANAELMEKREKARKDYGDAAKKILAMESALEMRFESEFALNPQLWPNIPFRF